MTIEVSALTVVATIGIALLGPTLAVLFGALWESAAGRSASRRFVQALGPSGVGWVAWIVAVTLSRPELDPLLLLPLTGLAGLAAILATVVPRILGYSAPLTLLFAAIWVLTVFAPIAIALFSLTDGFLGAGLATLDLAGALPVLVAAGCAGSAVLVMERSRQRLRSNSRSSPAMISATFLVVWLLWILWLVGLELAVDDVTGRIILNTIIAPITSTLAWLIVQRIRHARTTTVATVIGLFCGLVAIAPGYGYLDPVGAALTGGIAGAACSLTGYALERRTAQPAWLLLSVLVVAASTGVALLGAFATRSGLMFTGQPEVLFRQLASVVLVVIYAVVVSAAGWLAVRALAARRRAASGSRHPQQVGDQGGTHPD